MRVLVHKAVRKITENNIKSGLHVKIIYVT